MRGTAVVVLLGSLGAGACAATGTRPHEMSASQHERAATEAEAEAARVGGSRAVGQPCGNAPCTSGSIRQTDDSRYLLDLAQRHRAAAKTLREAEQSACDGVSDEQRRAAPLASHDVVAASRYEQRQGKYGKKLLGAVIEVRGSAGTTADQLQRSIVCHLAHVAVSPDANMGACPFAVQGATAEVDLAGDYLVVRIAADQKEAAQEIWARARALATR